MTNLLIVDPIFRGSRLHYTNLVAKNLLNDYRITIVNRRTDNSSDKIGGVEYINLFNFPNTFWFGRVGFSNFIKLIRFLINWNSNNGDKIYFPGLNEWMPWFVFLGPILALKKVDAIAIDYEGKYWIPQERDRLRDRLARLIRHAITSSRRIKIGILDERVEFRSNPNTFFVPDPPIYPAIQTHLAGPSSNFPSTQFLTFGVQSERKGIRLINDLLKSSSEVLINNKIFIKCIGPLAADTKDLDDSLRRFSGNGCFQWIPNYISQDQLEDEAKQADVILLPYHPSFQGSSGVLAHACLWGKPILATAHGVIGFRVKKHALGTTFEYTPQDLLAALCRFDGQHAETHCFKAGRTSFLDTFCENKHIASIATILKSG